MTSVDPNARYIPLEGLSLAIVAVSLIFLFLSVLTVSGRTYIRRSEGVFGLDDGLMLFGTIVYIAAVALSSYAAFVGLGVRDDKLNAFFSEEGKKYFTIWILVYVHALATIKSSICITILRIAGTRRAMRIAVWVLLAITWASYMVTFIGDLLVCRPIEATWKPELVLSGQAYCAPMELMIALSHTATGSTVATDLACAVLPGIILWNTQMNTKAKISAYVLLSFASMASIVTIIRAFYITHYNTPLDNLLFWVGHIALLSNIEIGIGCIASSVPTLRRFFVHKGDSSQDSSRKPWDRRGSKSLITFGSLPNHDRGSGSRSKFRNPTDTGFSLATVHAQGDWERLQDADSAKNMETGGSHGQNGIRADYTYTVELSQSSKQGRSFYLSGEGI